MNTVSDIGISIIGVGNIAHEHARVLNSLDGVYLKGAFSRTAKNTEEFATVHKTTAYRDLDSLTSDEPEGIIVAVSADQIFRVSKELLPCKIPLLIEKPPGLSLEELGELASLAKKFSSPNMIGLNRRFMSHFLEGVRFLNEHGPLLGLLIEGHERLWQLENSVDESLIRKWIYANSIHTIDLLRYFGGEVSEQLSLNRSFTKKHTDQFNSIFRMENDCLATYISHWSSPGSWGVKLMGNGVSVLFSPLESGFTIDRTFSKTSLPISKYDQIFKPGFYNQMLAFKHLIEFGNLEWPAVDLDDSLKTYEIATKMILETI